MRDQADDLDEAINDVFKTHEPGSWVTEWLLVAVTQSPDDQPGTSGYITLNRPGMLHHHIRGLLDTADASTSIGLISDDDDDDD